MLNQYQNFIRHELVPAIRMDCADPDIEVIAAGASIGAFNSLAILARYPEVFRAAICMSGTYDMNRFLPGETSEDFYYSSPLHFLPDLGGDTLEKLKTRFVLLASGEGRAENIGESWRVAHVLGQLGVPNRVDSWGAEWHHDWPTWRNMMPKYLEELVPA
jgi:esterase/lipase superfamily enzyme